MMTMADENMVNSDSVSPASLASTSRYNSLSGGNWWTPQYRSRSNEHKVTGGWRMDHGGITDLLVPPALITCATVRDPSPTQHSGWTVESTPANHPSGWTTTEESSLSMTWGLKYKLYTETGPTRAATSRMSPGLFPPVSSQFTACCCPV